MMFLFVAIATLALATALATQAGVVLLQRAHPARGRTIEISGATLHVVDLGPRDATGPPIVMLHGASSNLEMMRQPLGGLLVARHRVILIDRPGHGWSRRARARDATAASQAGMIAEGLQKLGVGPVVLVVHSLSGALGSLMALDHPHRLAGLVMLAPVTHPWRGGVGLYNKLITVPVIGWLLASTVTLPLGLVLARPATRTVFLPQAMPEGFIAKTATLLVLRPREFLANAWDLVMLKPSVTAQVARYGDIKLPVTVISGDADKTVSTSIHSRPFATTVPNARLIVLPGVGHMVQNAAPDIVVSEIEAMVERVTSNARTHPAEAAK
jgi:pimeloyl-ACP methyl ester carboxylesterase